MQASCQCGSLTATIADGVEPTVVACHCVDCQKRSGSPFGTMAYYPRDAVAVSGEAREFAPDGLRLHLHHRLLPDVRKHALRQGQRVPRHHRSDSGHDWRSGAPRTGSLGLRAEPASLAGDARIHSRVHPRPRWGVQPVTREVHQFPCLSNNYGSCYSERWI